MAIILSCLTQWLRWPQALGKSITAAADDANDRFRASVMEMVISLPDMLPEHTENRAK